MATKYAFAQSLKELRFHLCQTSEHSTATRNFLLRTYPTMKKHNPHTPILIREASNTEPKVWARYGTLTGPYLGTFTSDKIAEFGRERMIPLSGLDDKAIENKVTELVKGSS